MSETATIPVESNCVSTKSKNPIPPQLVGKGFKPGQSGNPGGGTKVARALALEIRNFLSENHPKEQDKTRLRVLMESLIKKDPRIILAYGFGKPLETIALQNPDGTEIMRPLKDIPTERLQELFYKVPATNGNGRHNGN